jgi:hypothetical protein
MKRRSMFYLVAVLALSLLPLAAQALPGPDVTPVAPPAAITFTAILMYARAHPLQAGAFLSGLIYGLRNVPVFADIFVRWPKFGVVVNAATSLFVQVGACLAAGMTADMPMCLLTAVGMFLSAAGVHMVVSTIGKGVSISGSATVAATPDGSVVTKATGDVVSGPSTARAFVPHP